MSSTNKYNTTYSAADIEKYLKGELSPREMHDLENAALEDPFLADALDGMSILLSSAPAADVTPPPADLTGPAPGPEKPGHAEDTSLGRDLDELHTRLNARVVAGQVRNNIRRPFPRWSIAATIILLLGIGCAIYYTFITHAPSKVAAPSSSVVASSPPPAETATLPKASPPVAAAPAEPLSAAPTEQPPLARTTAHAPARRRHEEANANEANAREANAHEDKPSHERATADLLKKLPPAPARQMESRLEGLTIDSSARLSVTRPFGNRTANSLVFSGRVLDNHDNPVQGASLTLKGYTNTGTVTDRQGQFKLYLPPRDSSRYLTVAMIGYGQKSLPLNTLTADDMADHVIHLQPNETSLDEVVVSGFGSKRKETLAAVPSDSKEELDSLWHKARPVIGRYAYLHYLDTAQKALALDSSITGTETVSFEVDKKGTLTSFKIEQSLSPLHDEAIIRLVKKGPAWQLLKRKKVRALVSLHF